MCKDYNTMIGHIVDKIHMQTRIIMRFARNEKPEIFR